MSGYVPLVRDVDYLRIGSSTKEEVLGKLGEPLNKSTERSNSIIYVQKRVETFAFLRPRIEDRKVMKLTFNQASILSGIDYYYEIDGQPIRADEKTVVSGGRKLTFYQQMFGNIGNFSAEQFLE
jgi:outer membrane protein assembly factor BamE (lipoprotein component of BamABCDE complex)